jgi:hypothetical protein
VAVKVAEVQNMARHVLRNALVLWLSGQHLNWPCKSSEATKATDKQKWPTLRNVGIRYRYSALRPWSFGHVHACTAEVSAGGLAMIAAHATILNQWP